MLNAHALRAFLILFVIATYVFASVLDIEHVVAVLLKLHPSVFLFMFFLAAMPSIVFSLLLALGLTANCLILLLCSCVLRDGFKLLL